MEFINIRNQKLNELEKRKTITLNYIKNAISFEGNYAMVEDTKKYIGYTLTKLQAQKTLEKQKEILTKKAIKEYEKNKNNFLTMIEELENCKIDDINLNINIEWVKNKTWGNNPNCEIYFFNYENSKRVFGNASGCGYDKESSAIAKALNQIKEVKALLNYNYEIALQKDNNITFRSALGYGADASGFDGGVGTNCFITIFEKCGYKMEHIASGKMFDSWIVRQIKNK